MTIGIQNGAVASYAIVEAGADRNKVEKLVKELQSTGAEVAWYGFEMNDNLQEEIDDLLNYYDVVLVAATAGKKIG